MKHVSLSERILHYEEIKRPLRPQELALTWEMWRLAIEWDTDLPAKAIRVRGTIEHFSDRGTGLTHVGQSRRVKMSGLSLDLVKKANVALIAHGYLCSRRRMHAGKATSSRTSICIPLQAAIRLREALPYMTQPKDKTKKADLTRLREEAIDRLLRWNIPALHKCTHHAPQECTHHARSPLQKGPLFLTGEKNLLDSEGSKEGKKNGLSEKGTPSSTATPLIAECNGNAGDAAVDWERQKKQLEEWDEISAKIVRPKSFPPVPPKPIEAVPPSHFLLDALERKGWVRL